jgi:hypothetical protein
MVPFRLGGLALVGALLSAFALYADDLSQVERRISREPAYRNEPLYCLVVFGKTLHPRIWLVLDGKHLYVDRNGSGDLTEPGKRFEPTSADSSQFPQVEIEAADRVTRKLQLFIYDWRPGEAARPEENGPSLTVDDQEGRTYGAWGDQESAVIWSRRPESAPILHIGGPLRMGFEVRAKNAFVHKDGDTYELNVGVGTPGFGPGTFTHLKYWNNAIPESLKPSARLEFANKTPGGLPIQIEVTLRERC